MKLLALYKVGVFILVVSFAGTTYAASNNDRTALRNTSEAIRVAFAKGDVATAMRYHHPDVNKALSFHKVLIGRDAVAADLRNTLQQFRLEFVENNVESLLIENKTAVEQTLFTIKGTPVGGGQPFFFKGRAMVVYVRYKGSPTGWASIREIIQPASELNRVHIVLLPNAKTRRFDQVPRELTGNRTLQAVR